MKIGIWGYFGYRNCGDDLLLLILNEHLQCISDDINQITVFGEKKNVKALLPQENVIAVKRTAFSALHAAFHADLFLVGSGGIFPSTNARKLLFYLILTGIMKLRKKRIGFIGVGIGMFQRKVDIVLINKIAELADTFVSRSENYLNFVPEIEEKNILLASDMVFTDKKPWQRSENKSSKLVVVALADIFASNTDEYKELFIEEILIFFKFILKKGYFIHLIPFTNEIDEKFQNEICRRLVSEKIKSIPYQGDPYAACQEISKGELCIGMRFHALVMSFMMDIPVMSISYSDKNEDLMRRFGLGGYSVRFGISKKEYYNEEIMIEASNLISVFETMERQKEDIKEKIASHLPEIKEQSERNIRELEKLLR